MPKTLRQKTQEIFQQRDALFQQAGGDPKLGNEQLKNKELVIAFAKLIDKELQMRGISLKEVEALPEFMSGKLAVAIIVIQELHAMKVAKAAQEIYQQRNALLQQAGGDPNQSNERLIQDSKLVIAFAKLVYKELRVRNMYLEDIATLPEFTSGKLNVAQAILREMKNGLIRKIYEKRDGLWDKAARLSNQDPMKQLIIFMLILRTLFAVNGFSMKEAEDHTFFQSGRLQVAMKLYLKIKTKEVSHEESEAIKDSPPKQAFFDNVHDAARKLALQHAAEGAGLVTRAGIDRNVGDVVDQAKQIIAQNSNQDDDEDINPEILAAADKIIELNEAGELDDYEEMLAGERAALAI